MKYLLAIVLAVCTVFIISELNTRQGTPIMNTSPNSYYRGQETNTNKSDSAQLGISISGNNKAMGSAGIAVYTMPHEPGQLEKIQAYAKSTDKKTAIESELDMSHVSKEMEATFYSFPRLFNVLMHFNLMHGNTISDRELLTALSEKDHPYHADLHARSLYAYASPDTYEALNRYELTVVGELLSPDSIDELVNTQSFEDYKNYLISDGIIVPFCETNPDDRICGNRTQ